MSITAWVRYNRRPCDPSRALQVRILRKYRPQLFDLKTDSDEASDLAAEPRCANVLKDCEATLRELLSPEEVDARAKKRQAEQLARYGGREAVIARGDLGFFPPPGIKADFH